MDTQKGVKFIGGELLTSSQGTTTECNQLYLASVLYNIVMKVKEDDWHLMCSDHYCTVLHNTVIILILIILQCIYILRGLASNSYL